MEWLNGMNALTLVFVAILVFAIAYRFYGLFLANKLLRLDDNRITPAVKYEDGSDYVPENKNVLFGHHFAAIAAAGPLVGPVLAAQFGFLPGALWILIGCVLGGGVHDMVVLFASVRHKGQSLATIARKEIGPTTGTVAGFAVLFILVLTLAGLSIACSNAMKEAPWSLFIVASTIPIAIIMGIIMRIRHNSVTLASIVGIALLVSAIVMGHPLTFLTPEQTAAITADPSVFSTIPLMEGGFGRYFFWGTTAIAIMIPTYGFFASVLPVWLLLVPRDYLSTYLKIGTILMLAVGIAFVRPTMEMPALTEFINGGGPVIGGKVIPFLFITIACGALSGFHAIIGTGTTPKMISKEREILFVGYGAMLMEGFVAIMALIAACTLVPGDYFAINTPAAAYDTFMASHPTLVPQDLAMFSKEVGINLAHRPGGAVSLAVGMAHIFHKIPYMDEIMSYWYNFAIMFEAVFILTAIDAGTRVGRFFLQEMLGRVMPRFNDKNWMPGLILTSLVFTSLWGYLLYTGNISTIWPLFGMSNQLLAGCALIVSTTMLLRMNRGKYALCTALPGFFIIIVTMWAGYLLITGTYWPQGKYLLSALAALVMVLMVFVFCGAFLKWRELMNIKTTVKDSYGEDVKQLVEE